MAAPRINTAATGSAGTGVQRFGNSTYGKNGSGQYVKLQTNGSWLPVAYGTSEYARAQLAEKDEIARQTPASRRDSTEDQSEGSNVIRPDPAIWGQQAGAGGIDQPKLEDTKEQKTESDKKTEETPSAESKPEVKQQTPGHGFADDQAKQEYLDHQLGPQQGKDTKPEKYDPESDYGDYGVPDWDKEQKEKPRARQDIKEDVKDIQQRVKEGRLDNSLNPTRPQDDPSDSPASDGPDTAEKKQKTQPPSEGSYDDQGNLTHEGGKKDSSKTEQQAGKGSIKDRAQNKTQEWADRANKARQTYRDWRDPKEAIKRKGGQMARQGAARAGKAAASGLAKLGSGVRFLIQALISIIQAILTVLAPYLGTIILIIILVGAVVAIVSSIFTFGGDGKGSGSRNRRNISGAFTPNSLTCSEPVRFDNLDSYTPSDAQVDAYLDNSDSWGVNALLNAVDEYAQKSGESESDLLLRVAWLWFENPAYPPDPYFFNCDDKAGQYNIGQTCVANNNGLIQVGGFQFQDKVVQNEIIPAYQTCHGDKDVSEVLQSVYNKSTNATRPDWNYQDPQYSTFVDTYLSGGNFSNVYYLKGYNESEAGPDDIVIDLQNAISPNPDLQNQALAFMLGKDPCMVIALNSAASRGMTSELWFNDQPHYADEQTRKKLVAATMSIEQLACTHT